MMSGYASRPSKRKVGHVAVCKQVRGNPKRWNGKWKVQIKRLGLRNAYSFGTFKYENEAIMAAGYILAHNITHESQLPGQQAGQANTAAQLPIQSLPSVTPPSALPIVALSLAPVASPSPDVVAAPPPTVDAQAVDANPELMPTFPALPMPLPGGHLAAIEKRIMGKSFQHESATIERLEQLERHLGLPLPSNMSIEKRIIRIETKAISIGF